MLIFLIWLAFTLEAPSEQNVLLVNDTDLQIARIEIDERKFEGDLRNVGKILINVTPAKHHLKIVFLGGADVDWPEFNFKGVREIVFERSGSKIEARVE